MIKIVEQLVFISFLIIVSWQDMKNRSVALWTYGLFGSCAWFLNLCRTEQSDWKALACGIPTVVRDIPVYAGWLRDGKNVYKASSTEMFQQRVTGLLEHTLSVVKFCEYMAGAYPILNKDLLYTAAMCHDIGKIKELSPFPENDYTDDGQLLGHIVMGVEMVDDAIRTIPEFPPKLASELKHCILAHHGELEYGSPKKPALAEAFALNFADCADAKMQTLIEIFKEKNSSDWLGYNRLFETNLRKTSI